MTQENVDAARPVLLARSVTKTFPGQVALDDVGITVLPGQIHALVGQNGSGKSTLIKILAGVHRADPGATVELDGSTVRLDEATDSIRDRIRVMHQDLGLVASMNVMENLALGHGFQATRFGRISWVRERRIVADLLRQFDLDLDPTQQVSSLSASERAIVGLARAIHSWNPLGGLLVLDEPTASLTRPDVLRLFDAVRRVAARGAGVLFVSHRVEEVFDIADQVSVLRDGVMVGTWPIAELDHSTLVELIVGRPLGDLYTEAPAVDGETIFEVHDLWGDVVAGFHIALGSGEIIGVAGLDGSGREEIAALLSGAKRPAAGSIAVAGRNVEPEPRAAQRIGVSYIPSDRKELATIPHQTVSANTLLGRVGSLFTNGWLSERREHVEAARWTRIVGVQPADPRRTMDTLSGGNQQKVVLARVLRQHPRVIVLDEPTQGVDVGAKATIYELLARAAAGGAALVLCSSDADELANVCDRVLVMRHGAPTVELSGPQLTPESITERCLL